MQEDCDNFRVFCDTRTRQNTIYFPTDYRHCQDIGCSTFLSATLTMTMNCDYSGHGARAPYSQPRSGVTLIQSGTLIARLLYAVVCAIRNSLLLHRFYMHARRSRMPSPPQSRARVLNATLDVLSSTLKNDVRTHAR